MDIKEGLTFDGLKYFYTKYIKPLKSGAFATVVNNGTTTVANTVLDGRMGKTLADKDANLQSQINSLNSSLVKYKDVTVKNVSINTPDGDGYFAYVNNLDVVIPEHKNIIGAMVVAFDSLPGAVVPYLHLNQSIPGLYLYSSKEGTVDMMIIRVIYT